MKTIHTLAALAVALGAGIGSHAHAALAFDANVTPDVIFGSGNANGGFTVDSQNGVELGLRGKLRHNAAGAPENTFNSNGDGTYSFNAGVAPTQGGNTAVWSVEFSVNSDVLGTAGRNLSSLTYQFGLDTDASQGTAFTTFDIINLLYADHALGDNSTGNGGGSKAADAAAYATGIANNNVAQNSQKAHWLLGTAFDESIDGTYSFFLSAFDNGVQIARTDIDIIVGAGGASAVPEPGSLALAALALTGLGVASRRRRQA